MATLSLDEIRAMVERKYAPLVVPFGDGQSVTLRATLMLSSDERKALAAIDDGKEDEEFDEGKAVDKFARMVRVLASSATDADAFLAEVNGTGIALAILSETVQAWSKATQPGEAGPSQS